jgi:hypothetical protein
MKNVIFGSGITGLFAKALLPGWTVIPFGRSRFFTFNPALDDNFIICSEEIDEPVRDICRAPTKTFLYRRAFDVGGHLFGKYDKGLCQDWLTKIFGLQVPGQAEPYMNNRLDLFIYDIRVNQLYGELLQRYLGELKEEHAKGKITEIGDHYFVRNGKKEEFDNAVNTIPLNVLNNLMGLQQELPAKPAHFFHIQTKHLDFEGYNQTLITDSKFSFYKVANIAPDRYLFYCHEEIQQPGPYFMALMPDFEILDGTSVGDYIPMGPMPNLEHLEQKGVYSVGSYAQWDWCIDVSSCITRLVRYANRNFKPFKKQILVRP